MFKQTDKNGRLKRDSGVLLGKQTRRTRERRIHVIKTTCKKNPRRGKEGPCVQYQENPSSAGGAATQRPRSAKSEENHRTSRKDWGKKN